MADDIGIEAKRDRQPHRWPSTNGEALQFGCSDECMQGGRCSRPACLLWRRDWERQHPLAHQHLGDDMVNQMSGGLGDAPRGAGGADAAALAASKRN